MRKILVLGINNTCRSIIAQGYLQQFLGHKFIIESAGVKSKQENTKVHPRTIAIMQEDGVDVSQYLSCSMAVETIPTFDIIVAISEDVAFMEKQLPESVRFFCREFKDPTRLRASEEAVHKAFEDTRNEIKAFCKSIIKENHW